MHTHTHSLTHSLTQRFGPSSDSTGISVRPEWPLHCGVLRSVTKSVPRKHMALNEYGNIRKLFGSHVCTGLHALQLRYTKFLSLITTLQRAYVTQHSSQQGYITLLCCMSVPTYNIIQRCYYTMWVFFRGGGVVVGQLDMMGRPVHHLCSKRKVNIIIS